MRIYDYSSKSVSDVPEFPNSRKNNELFVLLRPAEITSISGAYGFDEGTVRDCSNLDESVRYTSFDGYDFISIIDVQLTASAYMLREINMYISSGYLVLVMPEHDSPRLAALESKLHDYASQMDDKPEKIIMLYFTILNSLLTDFSDTLEALEDQMQAVSEKIVANVETCHFAQIDTFRNTTYTIKKLLRALSYLGDQILFDENKLLVKNQIRYFRNLNTRLKRLYDFSESLYNLSNELLYTYDSRLTTKTNETVNRLTTITLFFGPLTVITGIYGMNFVIMPELSWPFGYPLALLLMAVVSLILFFVLKSKKWL